MAPSRHLAVCYHAQLASQRARRSGRVGLEYKYFQQYLASVHGDPVFIEFLQHVFPWLLPVDLFSCSSVQQVEHMPFSIQAHAGGNQVSSFLFAAHAGGKASLRLLRSRPERPRCSWSQLLHTPGESATLRLKAKLFSLILEVFDIAHPQADIFDCEWGDDGSCPLRFVTRVNGDFRASIVLLLHHDSSALQQSDHAIAVDLHLHSPSDQDLLPVTDRDVIISIDVQLDDAGPVEPVHEPGRCSAGVPSIKIERAFGAELKLQDGVPLAVQVQSDCPASDSTHSRMAWETTSLIAEFVDTCSTRGTFSFFRDADSRCDAASCIDGLVDDNDEPVSKKTKVEHVQQSLVRLNAMCASDSVELNGASFDDTPDSDTDSVTSDADSISERCR
jgi:hypothetical protein